MIENTAYHRRLFLHKSLLQPDDLLYTANASELDVVTYGCSVASWHLRDGNRASAIEVFERVVAGPY